jgi:integrase
VVAVLVAAGLIMHIQFPVYRRGNTLVLHVRIAGRQVKRTLRTLDPNLAKVRATQMLGALMAGELAITQPATHAWSAVNPQSTDAAIQQDLLTPEQALAIACSVPVTSAPSMNAGNSSQNRLGRRGVKLPDHEKHQLAAVFSEYGQIKKLRQVTKNDYASYGKEMVEFWGNRDIRTLVERDISDLIIHLRSAAGNDPRTIDNKTGYVRAVINFLVKHGRHPGPNPASDKNLVSKREKRKAGTKPFAYNDLKVVFGGEEFRRYGGQRPEIYLICMVGLVTGMRVSSVARLTAADLKRSMHGTPYIDISNDKTIAGNRDIPIPELLSTALGKFFDGHDDFGLQEREDGKGYSDQLNKPLKAFMKVHGYDKRYTKMSFHAFRKSFNQHLLTNNVDRYICGAILGHVDESMTTGVYADPPSVDFLAEKVCPKQVELLEYLGFGYPIK